ncbi:hypothetical protein HLH28_04150 [Gluconacetobacter tumulisoli]|uniref:Mannosyltransferase n=1 Tax=Gluconacetobacter tumulisoli TaxID=1286189 RepID=A0A7W4K5W9_9PROT|nr:hypothetical protein [Gluconacetobacter tumulisoli]MBB2200775.1 hypothetical protein [Gluconacetobacter tumulisoli]
MPGSRTRTAGCVVLLNLLLLVLLAVQAWPLGGLPHAVCHWDCAWYERIATHGYSPHPMTNPADFGQASWAFFPLYPLLVRAVMAATGLGADGAGLAINVALFPLLALLAAAYMRQKAGDADGLFRVALFVILPTGFWYRLPYTEGLYGVLLLSTAMAMARGWTMAAALLAAGLCLTRPTGLFCVAVIALFHMFAPQMAGPAGRTPPDRLTRWVEGTVLVLAGAAGLALFIFFLDGLVGDGLAFGHVQAAWGHRFLTPVVWLYKGFTHRKTLDLAIAAVLEIALICWGFRIRWAMESTILLVTFLLASSTSLMSIHRIVLANPFADMLVALLACRLPPRWRPWLVLLCLGLDVVFANSWLHGKRFLG